MCLRWWDWRWAFCGEEEEEEGIRSRGLEGRVRDRTGWFVGGVLCCGVGGVVEGKRWFL